jgi:hypothetical protein
MKNKLNAYVRYDGSGRIVPGSLILQKNKPKVGKWKETAANKCCSVNPNCVYFTIESTEGFQDFEYGFIVVDDGGDPVIFTINFGDGNSEEIVVTAGSSTGHVYTYELGTYNGSICMSDPTRVDFFRAGND